jgi:hypothetical protein
LSSEWTPPEWVILGWGTRETAYNFPCPTAFSGREKKGKGKRIALLQEQLQFEHFEGIREIIINNKKGQDERRFLNGIYYYYLCATWMLGDGENRVTGMGFDLLRLLVPGTAKSRLKDDGSVNVFPERYLLANSSRLMWS